MLVDLATNHAAIRCSIMRSVSRAKLGVVAVVLLIAGCTRPLASGREPGPTKPVASAMLATIWTGFPLASGVTCPDIRPLGLSRVLLTSRDSKHPAVVLCDAHDLKRPRTLPGIQPDRLPTFLAESKVGYPVDNGAPIPDWAESAATLDLTTGATEKVATAPGLMILGWSHNQKMIAYMNDTAISERFWLQPIGAAAIALTPPIPVKSHRVGEADAVTVAFSADDRYVLFVDTWVQRLQVFKASDGTVVYTAPSGDAGGLRTMAVWTHKTDRFYFRDATGVYSWDAKTGASSFAAGLQWRWPVLSPDDRYLAYTTSDKSGTPRVEIRNLDGSFASSSLTWRGTYGLTGYGFTGSGTLLEVELEPCHADLQCPVSFTQTGKTLTLQVDSGTEKSLTPAPWLVDDYWPHD